MLRKTGIILVAAALGFSAAFGAAACGEDRDGEVQIENGGTGTAGTGTGKTGTGTTGTTGTGTTGGSGTTEGTGTEGTGTGQEPY
jgi:hypothetical protein